MSVYLEPHVFDGLRRYAGPDLEILTDSSESRFQELSRRWSDIDRQIPAAIVLPESEEQIQRTVSLDILHENAQLRTITKPKPLPFHPDPMGRAGFGALCYKIRWPQ